MRQTEPLITGVKFGKDQLNTDRPSEVLRFQKNEFDHWKCILKRGEREKNKAKTQYHDLQNGD